MKKIIIANWKTGPEALEKAKKLVNSSLLSIEKSKSNFEFFFASPSVYIYPLLSIYKNIILQDIFQEEMGAFTGKFGAKIAKSVGIKMSIIGHSETRESKKNKKGYTNLEIAQKIRNLLDNKMSICLCFGEEERNKNYKEFLKKQLLESFSLIKKEEIKNIILAYEPVWAIGKDAKRPATNTEVEETITYTKSLLKEFFGEKESKNVKILYGGSVDSENIKGLLEQKYIDGLLIGRASSDISSWKKLLNNIF